MHPKREPYADIVLGSRAAVPCQVLLERPRRAKISAFPAQWRARAVRCPLYLAVPELKVICVLTDCGMSAQDAQGGRVRGVRVFACLQRPVATELHAAGGGPRGAAGLRAQGRPAALL